MAWRYIIAYVSSIAILSAIGCYIFPPGDFWQMVEAICVFVTGFFLIYQVSSLWGHRGGREIQGLYWVQNNLFTKGMEGWIQGLNAASKVTTEQKAKFFNQDVLVI